MLVIFYISLTVSISHKEAKINNELILWTSIVVKLRHGVPLCCWTPSKNEWICKSDLRHVFKKYFFKTIYVSVETDGLRADNHKQGEEVKSIGRWTNAQLFFVWDVDNNEKITPEQS